MSMNDSPHVDIQARVEEFECEHAAWRRQTWRQAAPARRASRYSRARGVRVIPRDMTLINHD